MKIADIHFLVVEDHEFQRATLVHTLGTLGARNILEAADGHAALAMLQRQPIDLVISDLEMPRMDGMEFIRHVSESGVAVSIILTSVHDQSLLASVGTMTQAYGVNLLGTIGKPVHAQKLEALIGLHKTRVIAPPGPAQVAMSEADISDALAARLFEPVYQPKVDVATGVLKGVEALARWIHPQQGMVGPYAFIPALEANRRIDELTWIMLEKAAASCRDWRAAGLDITVAVNLSLGSLTRVGLADHITELVQAQNVAPKYITLEVTETIAMTDIARALENLTRLRIRGFGLSIDDYGTGYSSMQQLSRIPFTEIKIDQSFVMRAVEKDSCRVMLESSLEMARKLRLQAVAEGVETRADWDLLKAIGCDAAQGYFIARPMPSAHLAAWASGWAPPG